MRTGQCQIHCLPRISEGRATIPRPSLGMLINLAITRPMHPRTKQKIKKRLNGLMLLLSGQAGRRTAQPEAPTKVVPLQAGDRVRVRSRPQIEATLDYWGELKGCGILDGMWQYCDTSQQVLKPLKRFLDEREFKMKRCRGIVLLDGVTCEGIDAFGRCDRSCYFFWRQEWLEKIETLEALRVD